MNRRGFISLLAGTAGTVLVPWRGQIAPRVFLPSRAPIALPDYRFVNNARAFALTEESLEEMVRSITINVPILTLQPSWLIVSPEVKHLIDTDPAIARAARLAAGYATQDDYEGL